MSSSLFSLLPVANITAVENALAQTFNTADVTDIKLLSGGLSGSSVYKIIINDKPYVLKLTPKEENTAAALPSAFELAVAAGIAPQLYYNDKSQGVTISEFINSQPLSRAFTADKLTRELALTIKTIHSLPFDSDGDDLFETVDQFIDQFKQSNILSGQIFDECFQNYDRIKKSYPYNDSDKVFSHNDLNPNNILCDGEKIWIIDWDVAFLNNRYIDLANTANFFIHAEEQEKAYLSIYFDHEVNNQELACFFMMRQICRIIYAMLMFQLAAKAKSTGYLHNQDMDGIDLKTFGALMSTGKISLAEYEGQFIFGKALLNEAVSQMRKPRFASALALFE